MKKYISKPIIIEAVQITEETFSAAHPNEEHLRDVLYDPKRKTATVLPPCNEHRIACIGDWIVRKDGKLFVHKNLDISSYELLEDGIDLLGQ